MFRTSEKKAGWGWILVGTAIFVIGAWVGVRQPPSSPLPQPSTRGGRVLGETKRIGKTPENSPEHAFVAQNLVPKDWDPDNVLFDHRRMVNRLLAERREDLPAWIARELRDTRYMDEVSEGETFLLSQNATLRARVRFFRFLALFFSETQEGEETREMAKDLLSEFIAQPLPKGLSTARKKLHMADKYEAMEILASHYPASSEELWASLPEGFKSSLAPALSAGLGASGEGSVQ